MYRTNTGTTKSVCYQLRQRVEVFRERSVLQAVPVTPEIKLSPIRSELSLPTDGKLPTRISA